MADMGQRRTVQAAVWDRLACKSILITKDSPSPICAYCVLFVFVVYNIKGNVKRGPKKGVWGGILHSATPGHIHSPIHLCDLLEEIHFE